MKGRRYRLLTMMSFIKTIVLKNHSFKQRSFLKTIVSFSIFCCRFYNETIVSLIIREFSQKISWIFKIFKNLMKIEFWWRQIFEILIIYKPSPWSHVVPQKIWARSVQPCWPLLDTNKQANRQTNTQTSQIYI